MENDADIIAGDFNSSAYRDRGKAGVSSIEETWETTPLIPPPDVVPMVPDEGIRRLLWFHKNKEDRNELASCKADANKEN